MEITDLVKEIRNGEYDEFIDILLGAAKTRKNWLLAEQIFELKVGDTVTISNTVSPKYLAGKPATVKSIELEGGKRGQGTITLDMGRIIGRFGPTIKVSPNLINVVRREANAS